MFTSITLTSHKKTETILRLLRRAGRTAFYEEFFGFDGCEYVLYYTTIDRA